MTNIKYLNDLLKRGEFKILSSALGQYYERRDLDSFIEVPPSFVEDISEIVPLMGHNTIMLKNALGKCIYIGAIYKLKKVIYPGGHLFFPHMSAVNCKLPDCCCILYEYDEDTGEFLNDNFIFSNNENDISNFILDNICRIFDPYFNNNLGEPDEEDIIIQ